MLDGFYAKQESQTFVDVVSVLKLFFPLSSLLYFAVRSCLPSLVYRPSQDLSMLCTHTVKFNLCVEFKRWTDGFKLMHRFNRYRPTVYINGVDYIQ